MTAMAVRIFERTQWRWARNGRLATGYDLDVDASLEADHGEVLHREVPDVLGGA